LRKLGEKRQLQLPLPAKEAQAGKPRDFQHSRLYELVIKNAVKPVTTELHGVFALLLLNQ
jgi:hypothetical protein